MEKYKVGGKFVFLTNAEVGYTITEIDDKAKKIHLKPIDINKFSKPHDTLDSISFQVVEWLLPTIWEYCEPTKDATLFNFNDL